MSVKRNGTDGASFFDHYCETIHCEASHRYLSVTAPTRASAAGASLFGSRLGKEER
jgi:hypothetical protein